MCLPRVLEVKLDSHCSQRTFRNNACKTCRCTLAPGILWPDTIHNCSFSPLPELQHHRPLVTDERELGCYVGSTRTLQVAVHLVHAQQPARCFQVLLAIQAPPQHLGCIKNELDARTNSCR
jgi:hypothetical protein